MRDVDALAALMVEDPDVRRASEPPASFIHAAPQTLVGAAVDGDGFAAHRAGGLLKELAEVAVPVLHVFHEDAEQRLALASAVVHAFFDAPFADSVAAHVRVGDGAGRHPDRPLPGFSSGPCLQIGVEGPDRSQDWVEIAAAFAV